MRTSTRIASIATCGLAAATLSACTVSRTVALEPAPAPVVAVAAAPPAVVVPAAPAVVPVAALEYGRVSNIEYFPSGTAATRINVPGAVVGAVAGRDPATVLGGAAAGPAGTTTAVNTPYRVTIQTDAGIFRIYDVPGTGDLKVGDRVRVENGVIYRS